MNCKEVAIFKFKKDSLEGAIELNKQLLSEMQKASENTLLHYEIYQSRKDPCVFTWLIDWEDEKSAKLTTDKWLSFPGNQEFSLRIENDIFYDFLEKR